jgi:thiol-disulfide isomerase/thioredoxin
MSARRVVLSILAVLTVAVAVVAMVRYTRRVEASMAHASVSGGTIGLLRDRRQIPDFTATTIDGRTLSLAALRGKVVLVNFWATWCPPCRAEIPDLVALQARYKDQLLVIGVSQDSGAADQVAGFVSRYGINYPIVMSTPEIERLFPNVYALPTSFVLDRDGRVAQKHVGILNASLTEAEARALAGLAIDARVEAVEDEDKMRLENAAQANKIPGVDLSSLTPDQRGAALAKLNADACSCGCGQTIAQCRLDDPTCTVSLPLAQKIVQAIAASPSRPR